MGAPGVVMETTEKIKTKKMVDDTDFSTLSTKWYHDIQSDIRLLKSSENVNNTHVFVNSLLWLKSRNWI